MAQVPHPEPFPTPAPRSEEPKEDPARQFLFPLAIDWEIQLPDVPVTWPAYDAAHAYVPTRSGELFAVSLDSGEILWCSEVDTLSPPVMGDRTIFVAANQAIVALETTIGDQRWRVSVGGEFSAPLLWDTGWLVACLEGGDILVLRGDTGELIWRRNLGATCRARPAIGGSSLYVPQEDGQLRAVDLRTGEPLWDQQLGGAVEQVLPLGNRLFTGSADNFFYSLSASDGRIRWRWRTGADITGEPLADQSHVYFGALDNVFRALDRSHGAQRWKQELPMRPIWGPSLMDKIVVLSGLGPEIRGYRTKDGEPAGFFIAPSELAAPPHLADGETADERRVYALTGDGMLLALLPRVDPLLEPLEAPLPGKPFPPPEPLGVLPGRRIGLPPHRLADQYLGVPIGLPPALQAAEVIGIPIGHPPADNDLPGVALGFPEPLPPSTPPGRPLSEPPPYWFEFGGIELGFPPIPDSLRLPGRQLSIPPPPRDPLPIELPGRSVGAPPPPPATAAEAAAVP